VAEILIEETIQFMFFCLSNHSLKFYAIPLSDSSVPALRQVKDFVSICREFLA